MDPFIDNRHRRTWMPTSRYFSLNQNSHRGTWSIYKAVKYNGLLNLSLPKVYAAGEVIKDQTGDLSGENLPSEAKDEATEFLVTDEEVNDYISKETGMDRLKEMFTKENRKKRYEVRLIKYGSVNAASLVAFYTLYCGYRQAKLDFVKQNKANVFKDHAAAARQMYYTTTFNALTVCKRWFIRTFLFTGMTLFVSQTLPVYRNKSSPFDVGIGAGLAASIWRFKGGPKASFAAGVLIGAVGTVFGTIFYGLLRLEGKTAEEVHFRRTKEILETKKRLSEPLKSVD